MDFISRLSTSAQRRVYRALLCRAIGRYLEGDLALEQLDVHLRAGTIDLRGLTLNVDAVNAMLAGEPVRVRGGQILRRAHFAAGAVYGGQSRGGRSRSGKGGRRAPSRRAPRAMQRALVLVAPHLPVCTT